MNGGALVAEALVAHGVRFVFTLCGGHISPILVESKRLGIRVVDTRHEATAVFAADAVARLTGVPGVAVVTAGPGVTNTITAVKNAQLAQSPLVLVGGAAATVLAGRGSLQDIDQMSLMEPHVKWMNAVRKVRHLPDAFAEAFHRARQGVPGPVFLEIPVDLLYEEEVVKQWYGAKSGGGGVGAMLVSAYLKMHTWELFRGAEGVVSAPRESVEPELPETSAVRQAAGKISVAERPLVVIGSQATAEAEEIGELAHAVERLGIPVYLTGMARGLLGKDHPLQMRHRRRKALKAADLVILAGAPMDFRLDYGRQIARSAYLVTVNRSYEDLTKNRRPSLAVHADSGRFLRLLSQTLPSQRARLGPWLERLAEDQAEREAEIAATAAVDTAGVNPVMLCRSIDESLPDDSVLVVDGGDFVATASYVVQPRGPLSWLDPGVFGTLGVGAGFALGAKLCRPEAEVWVLWGDGSFGYGLAEVDTFVRHELPIVGIIGNDACWMQIAREQVEILGDDVGCALLQSDYHRAAEGLGARGLLLHDPSRMRETVDRARDLARSGSPVIVNAHIGATDFRKGSISM